MAVEHVIEEGNQRRALATCGHVSGTKVRHHGKAEFCGDDGSFAGLPCASDAAAQKQRWVPLVIERLPVTADQFALQPGAALCRTNRVGIEFAEKEIGPREIGDAGRLRVHHCQNGTTHIVRVRELIVGQQLETRAEAASLDANQRDVDPVGRGAAHHAGDNHTRTSFAASAYARTSSLNSHISRRNLSTVVCVGAGAMRAFSGRDLFFAARTRFDLSDTSRAHFLSLSAFLYTASNARHTLSSFWQTRNMSAPARSVSTAASSIGAAANTPPMSRSSVMISPRYPIFLRRISLIHFFESDAGAYSPVTCGYAACATITNGNSRRSSRYGSRSSFHSRCRDFAINGRSLCESRLASPSPGKCLPHPITLQSRSPRRNSRPYVITCFGSAETVRDVSTFFDVSNCRSSTGAKSVLNPRARTSAPMMRPCLRKSFFEPAAATSATGGTGAITSRRRSTVPPSMSTQRNIGVEAAFCASRSSA